MKGEERPVCGPEKIERQTDRCEASQSRQTLQRQPGSLEFLEDVSPLIPEASSVLTDRWGLLAFNLCGVDKTLSESLGSPESMCESVLEIVALLVLHRPAIKNALGEFAKRLGCESTPTCLWS